MIKRKKSVFIAGIKSLTKSEKKTARKLIQKLKKHGHKVTIGK